MNKQISLIGLALVLLLGLTACQSKPTPPVADNQGTINGQTATGTITDSGLTNEANLIEALIKATKLEGVDNYQLHDTALKGDYARGRWSYKNDLQPEVFWANLSAGVWHLVYVGREGPACTLLAGWPGELQSGCRGDLNAGQISNFADCLKAGFKATAEMPRRCLDDKGNVFMEVTAAAAAKRYISQEVTKCRDLDFDCASTEKPFLDDVGCGCQGTTAVNKNFCSAASRLAQVCTQEYAPVCGWFDQTIKCLRYPCAQVYGNACQACQNQQVAYWTSGDCPSK